MILELSVAMDLIYDQASFRFRCGREKNRRQKCHIFHVPPAGRPVDTSHVSNIITSR